MGGLRSSTTSDTLMLLTGAHQIHRRFGETIGADNLVLSNYVLKDQSMHEKFFNLVNNVRKLPSGYPYVLTEACFYYPALRRRLGGLRSKIININCSPLLYKIANGMLRPPESNLMNFLLPEVDGYLLFGEYGKEVLKKTDSKKPWEVVYPFIPRESYDRLKEAKPDISKASITIFIAFDPYYKGLDILLQALSKTQRNLELNIVGKADVSALIKRYPVKNNVKINTFGFVAEVRSVFESTGLFVTMGRGDTFPVATLESMLAGVPALVSDQTGTKEASGKVDSNLVCPMDAETLSKRIEWFFDLKESERAAFSKSSRAVASGYDEDSMLGLFRKRFESLRGRL